MRGGTRRQRYPTLICQARTGARSSVSSSRSPLVDSLNPSTRRPGAAARARSARAARRRGVHRSASSPSRPLGGLVLVFGPGRALLAFVSHRAPHVVHLIEVAAGVLLLVAAAVLWRDASARRAAAGRSSRPQAGARRSCSAPGSWRPSCRPRSRTSRRLIAVTEGDAQRARRRSARARLQRRLRRTAAGRARDPRAGAASAAPRSPQRSAGI